MTDPIDIAALLAAYPAQVPDPAIPAQRVAFGTSGHRGSAFDSAFNEAHILAVTQAVCDWRSSEGLDGPLFVGRDTHALSEPALASALEVFAGNGVTVMVDAAGGYTPTPVISHAILTYNAGRSDHMADGVVITPSHNPPRDGGFKYNGPDGGPADTNATGWIERRANDLLAAKLVGVRRAAPAGTPFDYVGHYVGDLSNVIDMDVIARSGIRIGVDPLGGAGVGYWGPIAERYGLDLTVVNTVVDPAFGFMPPDWDGKIRMDCSSPFAMAGLIGMKDRYDIAFANDPDADRHGIVTPAGLMNPNHYLSAAIDYLLEARPGWSATAAVGKTVVTSAMLDRVAAAHGRKVVEVPVGFKWFVGGLRDGSIAFAGEESAGASFLRRDGSVWTTDKDGLILGLAAAEMTAATGESPSTRYARLTSALGEPFYARTDAPASPAQKAAFKTLDVATFEGNLAGDPVTAVTTTAPGNGAAFGGVKVATANGWFAARPSGTENVYKIYAESFVDAGHLARIQEEAQAKMARVFAAA
ncbi:phosphoglucomutase (alpha-D-glucose-1,6-bisphosphate-dependent) [Polymorphobacter sp. PAMC 29334]|uniref:phosphoglucomutase (alpha-D-glucose-1,6-bisphosphate-dependent) n=1 Tax=Polymorphobacter sp. PAMC 29334 TaxID=2862331 RepID=UPI0021025C40|nr:phosphoglucomutase (alpha-D-glucose-1,6-bisphosphate-dependent) [Polymorphobacter sp. PAMC 29334]